MKLGPTEIAVLSAAHMQANVSLQELHRETGLRADTIRYCLKRLRDRNLIQLNPIIDVYRLGYAQYGLFFSLSSESAKSHAAFTKFLAQSDRVSFVSELGGDFQFGITVCAADLLEVTQFVDLISSRFGNIFFEKMVAIRAAVTDFRVKHLLGHKHKLQYISWRVTPERHSIDDLDHRILSFIAQYGGMPLSELSRRLGLPYSTAEYRVKKLVEKKIIAGYRYLLNNPLLGIHSYLLLVYVKGLRADFKEEFFSFCWKHENIRYLVECLGGWDYELGVEAGEAQTITKVAQALQKEFGSDINTIKTLPVFGYSKIANYPFQTAPH
jgi:Lrp/AsnC family transcriptional regulator, leucine-responsive regulatory protein